jgi:hypothetical protein
LRSALGKGFRQNLALLACVVFLNVDSDVECLPFGLIGPWLELGTSKIEGNPKRIFLYMFSSFRPT